VSSFLFITLTIDRFIEQSRVNRVSPLQIVQSSEIQQELFIWVTAHANIAVVVVGVEYKLDKLLVFFG